MTPNAHVETSITPDGLKDTVSQRVPARRGTKPTTLNEIQAHNSSASLRLTFFPLPVTPADTVDPGHLQPRPRAGSISPIICSSVFCECHKVCFGLSKTFSRMSSQRERKTRTATVTETGGGAEGSCGGGDVRHASAVYLFYCCGNTFLLLQAAANTISLFLTRVTL